MTINCNEQVMPLSAVYSTYLNSRINCYDRLVQRIGYQLGAPLITLEAHVNAIYEFISIATEMFSQYAGFTKEYLVFNSTLYESGKGIRLDTLFTLTPTVNSLYTNKDTSLSPLTSLSAVAYDYNLENYRKVMDVFNFEEGASSGINTLFTIEQSLAQQTYFAYSQGNYGFDLVTWYTMKEWLKLREKILATLTDWKFNPTTQYLTLIPEPTQNQPYWGIVACYVEKTVSELIKEPWVQKYALALSKIAIGRTRGKFAGTQLFGGGSVNFTDILSEGLKEKDELEDKLFNGASAGFNADPPVFMVG